VNDGTRSLSEGPVFESGDRLVESVTPMTMKGVFDFPRRLYPSLSHRQLSIMDRREFSAGTALTLTGVLAGCLEGTLGSEATRPDPGDISIDGRLHNDTDETQTFDVTAETEDGYVLTDDAHEVSAGGTERIAAVGVPGATQAFTVAVGDAELSETLTIDVEPTEEVLDGYVEITYTAAREIELAVTPRSEFSDPDSVPVLTGHTVSDAVVTPDVDRESDTDAWGLFLASHGVAAEYFGDGDDDGAEEVRAFIEGTAFEDGDRLVYVRAYAPETCYELELGRAPFIAENGLPVVETEANRTASNEKPCGEAVTPVDLLVRLSFDADGPPADVVIVRVTGSAGNHREGFQVEAER
jgi:hypothetical protein